MTKISRRQELMDYAKSLGLYVRSWSPGDGVTRYRLFKNPGNSYFGPENGLYTALGLKELETFLRGYQTANKVLSE